MTQKTKSRRSPLWLEVGAYAVSVQKAGVWWWWCEQARAARGACVCVLERSLFLGCHLANLPWWLLPGAVLLMGVRVNLL